MVYLRVGGNATVCESHFEYGRDWKNKTGRILQIRLTRIYLQMEDCVIHLPRNKVVPV